MQGNTYQQGTKEGTPRKVNRYPQQVQALDKAEGEDGNYEAEYYDKKKYLASTHSEYTPL